MTVSQHSGSPHELSDIKAEVRQVPSNQVVWQLCHVSVQGGQAFSNMVDAFETCDTTCVLHLSKEPSGHQEHLHTLVHALPDSWCWGGQGLVGVNRWGLAFEQPV